MTRDQAYALYTVLLDAQSNKLEKELLKKDEKAWNKRFMEVFQEWLGEPSNVKAGIFSIEELISLMVVKKIL